MKKWIFCFLISLMAYSVLAQNYGWMDMSDNVPGDNQDLNDVFFISDDEGWITTSTIAEIYHTIDGGETFEIQTTPLGATQAVHMLDASNGYSGGAGGWVYNTYDGGLNWNILASMGTFLDISFPPGTDPNNPIGYACGDYGQVWEITSTLTNLNSGSASTFRGISAPSVNNVWVCGGGSIFYYNGSTFDGQSGPGGTFNDIHFINNQEGWVVGDGGVIGHTTDGGASWATQTNPDTQTRSLISIFFLDSNNGWAVGAYGVILSTTDGGTTWVVEGAGLTSEPLIGVHFISSTNGYVVGNNRTFLKYSEITSIENEEIPAEFLLLQNYPNPFNPQTVIQYQIPKVSKVSLTIYNIKGQLIKNLVKNIEQSGKHSVVWSGKDNDNEPVGSGIYFAKIKAGTQESVKRMILLK